MAEKTELTDTLSYGVDMKNRRIYFGIFIDSGEESPSDFTPASVEVAVRALHRMAVEAPGKPIELHMASYGGDPCAMLRLHDEILSCPCQIKFFGSGFIMSAATWIMVACDERYLHPNATIMVHDGWADMEGKHTDMQVFAKEEKRLQDLLYDIYERNTRMPKEFWAEVCQRDLYLTPSEAVSLGMADKIVEPKKRGNLRKMRQAGMKKAPTAAEMQSLVATLYSRVNITKVPSLVVNPVVKEPNDPNLIVDDKPLETEKPQSPVVTEALPSENQPKS